MQNQPLYIIYDLNLHTPEICSTPGKVIITVHNMLLRAPERRLAISEWTPQTGMTLCYSADKFKDEHRARTIKRRLAELKTPEMLALERELAELEALSK